MKKKKGLIVGISAVILALSAVLVWKFVLVTPQATVEQSIPSSPSVELSEEERIYKELIGNLTDVINDSEKAQIQTLIKKLIDIENQGDDKTQKVPVYKEIIEILDAVTLRAHSAEDLETYKKYYDATQDVTNGLIISEQYQYEIISDGSIAALTPVNASQLEQHKQLWEKTKTIIPFNLLTGIKYFVPFTPPKKESYAGGFMQPIDFSAKPYEWSLGIATIADEKILPYIFIHEYGHYISLKDTTLKFTDDFANLTADDGELIQNFLIGCNGHIAEELDHIDKNKHYLFYARHKDDFVSKYAASNSLDDFAESFAHFVMGSTYDSEILKKKMKFFEDRPELVNMKNQILANLKKNGIEEIITATE